MTYLRRIGLTLFVVALASLPMTATAFAGITATAID